MEDEELPQGPGVYGEDWRDCRARRCVSSQSLKRVAKLQEFRMLSGGDCSTKLRWFCEAHFVLSMFLTVGRPWATMTMVRATVTDALEVYSCFQVTCCFRLQKGLVLRVCRLHYSLWVYLL
jgi:hypothetical protein